MSLAIIRFCEICKAQTEHAIGDGPDLLTVCTECTPVPINDCPWCSGNKSSEGWESCCVCGRDLRD